MLNTYEARTDAEGNLKVPDGVVLPEGCRVLITVLEEDPKTQVNDEALLSEQALAEDWSTLEEDEAWQGLSRE